MPASVSSPGTVSHLRFTKPAGTVQGETQEIKPVQFVEETPHLHFSKAAGTVAGSNSAERIPELAPMPVPLTEGLPGRR
jgi:hypothetical protein